MPLAMVNMFRKWQRPFKCCLLYPGTGIGGGAIQNGNFIEGFSHPEMGHMLVKRHNKDNFSGTCPFHGDCLEA